TSGPSSEPEKAVNIGVAAHITAAAPGGPRYDPSLTSEERKSLENGIWLCQTCSVRIDRDAAKYTTELLREWKQDAEAASDREISGILPELASHLSRTNIAILTVGNDQLARSLALEVEQHLEQLQGARRAGTANDPSHWLQSLQKQSIVWEILSPE